jgi:hypothetical protein
MMSAPTPSLPTVTRSQHRLPASRTKKLPLLGKFQAIFKENYAETSHWALHITVNIFKGKHYVENCLLPL